MAPRRVSGIRPVEDSAGWQLVEAAQRGDMTAFGSLYATYAGRVWAFAYRRCGQHHLADDICAEAFARALRCIDTVSYRGSSPAAWLFTIARNLLSDDYKSARRQREDLVEDSIEPAQQSPSAEHAALDLLARAELRQAIGRLTAAQRECIFLRFFAGRSLAETAELTGRSVVAVKTLQHRAVLRLQQLLALDENDSAASGKESMRAA